MRVIASFVGPIALAFLLSSVERAQAQDTTPLAGEPLTATDPATLAYDYLVDGSLAADEPGNRRFRTLQAAYAAAPAGTADDPTVIGIAPNVYLLPATPTGNSLDITKDYITLLGLTNNRRSVVLADNRGSQQGGGCGRLHRPESHDLELLQHRLRISR